MKPMNRKDDSTPSTLNPPPEVLKRMTDRAMELIDELEARDSDNSTSSKRWTAWFCNHVPSVVRNFNVRMQVLIVAVSALFVFFLLPDSNQRTESSGGMAEFSGALIQRLPAQHMGQQPRLSQEHRDKLTLALKTYFVQQLGAEDVQDVSSSTDRSVILMVSWDNGQRIKYTVIPEKSSPSYQRFATEVSISGGFDRDLKSRLKKIDLGISD